MSYKRIRQFIDKPTLKEVNTIIVKIRKQKNLSEREIFVYIALSGFINQKIQEIQNEKKDNWYSWIFR